MGAIYVKTLILILNTEQQLSTMFTRNPCQSLFRCRLHFVSFSTVSKLALMPKRGV